MTPKHIQSAIVSTFTAQLAAHGLVLSPEVLADCAAQAATVIAAGLEECEDEGRDDYQDWLDSLPRRDAAYYANGENWRGE